ncbi:NAAT family transporter [Frateuria sp. Soil773]|uniref:MarC family protein n=1 Tax=Frateuria sp. Soil773 TaxID=1736407 RepID=UPI000AD55F4E|nr:NAAT family transporter [Frateuria sp. Soil773]
MLHDLAFAIKVFAALFAIMNPIANIPVFLSLTDGATDAERRKVASTAALGVAVGCVVSAVAGGAILHMFGLTVDDFRIAGGLLVLLIALSMVHGSQSTQHAATSQEKASLADSQAASMAVYPLTVPMLVGPGTVATLIVLGQEAAKTGREVELATGLVAFLAVLTVALLVAPLVGHFLSPKATAITQRLMGMILAAIAVQMILAGLRTALSLRG